MAKKPQLTEGKEREQLRTTSVKYITHSDEPHEGTGGRAHIDHGGLGLACRRLSPRARSSLHV